MRIYARRFILYGTATQTQFRRGRAVTLTSLTAAAVKRRKSLRAGHL